MKAERRRRQKGRRENSGVWGERRRKRKARRKGTMRKEQGERTVQKIQQVSFLFCLIFDFRQAVRADLLRGDGCTVYFCFERLAYFIPRDGALGKVYQ